MSLINEALRKAQRDRHLDSLPPLPGGGARPRRGNRMSTQTIVLIGAGALALFVLCVVGTVFLINRPTTPNTPVATKAPLKPSTTEATASSPMIVMPSLTKPPASTQTTLPPPAPSAPPPAPSTASASTAAGTKPAAAAPTRDPSSATTTKAATVTPLPATPPPAAPDKFDPRLQALVDGWRVTAVRFSGNESKLFMNGSVYRVDDVIDRTSGLRLTKVSPSSLTFTDAEGATYVKRY